MVLAATDLGPHTLEYSSSGRGALLSYYLLSDIADRPVRGAGSSNFPRLHMLCVQGGPLNMMDPALRCDLWGRE